MTKKRLAVLYIRLFPINQFSVAIEPLFIKFVLGQNYFTNKSRGIIVATTDPLETFINW